MLRRSFYVLLLHASFCVPAHADQPGPAQPLSTSAVHASRGIVYCETANDRDIARHRLDVYRPTGKGPYPVLVFVHGGAWMSMSKDNVLGIYGYGTIARGLAERGLVVVLPNYRLSPGVRHPEHINDVAQAFAWTCRNIADYGGDPECIFVGGHSAGGHLAALLATDETYLKRVGRTVSDIRGVLGLSGVYRLDEFDIKLPLASRLAGIPKVIRPLRLVFGPDPEVARLASPLTHVRPGLPPFLLMTGGQDHAPMRRMANEFYAALQNHGCEVEEKQIPRRTHKSLLFDVRRLSLDLAAADAVVGFINRHAGQVNRAELETRTSRQGRPVRPRSLRSR